MNKADKKFLEVLLNINVSDEEILFMIFSNYATQTAQNFIGVLTVPNAIRAGKLLREYDRLKDLLKWQ
jgi:hypothetical protein